MNRKNNTTIGLDIAKNVFHYAQLNSKWKTHGQWHAEAKQGAVSLCRPGIGQGGDGSLCRFALLGAAASGVWS